MKEELSRRDVLTGGLAAGIVAATSASAEAGERSAEDIGAHFDESTVLFVDGLGKWYDLHRNVDTTKLAEHLPPELTTALRIYFKAFYEENDIDPERNIPIIDAHALGRAFARSSQVPGLKKDVQVLLYTLWDMAMRRLGEQALNPDQSLPDGHIDPDKRVA